MNQPADRNGVGFVSLGTLPDASPWSRHPRGTSKWNVLTASATAVSLLAATVPLGAEDVSSAPMIDNTHDRVQTSLKPGLQRIGTIKPRHVRETGRSGLAIGCEMLPRNYGNFENFKAYIAPLGIKRIRIHAGWAKCEPAPGRFEFAWLDKQVDYCREQGLCEGGNTRLKDIPLYDAPALLTDKAAVIY